MPDSVRPLNALDRKQPRLDGGGETTAGDSPNEHLGDFDEAVDVIWHTEVDATRESTYLARITTTHPCRLRISIPTKLGN